MEEGGGALLALISLKNRQAFDKDLAPYIYLLPPKVVLAYVIYFDPSFLERSVGHISAADNTHWSGCDVENKIKKRTTPKP